MPGLIRRLFGRPAPDPIDDALWQRVRGRVRWVSGLDATRETRLRALAAMFVQHKSITPIPPLELDALQRATLAAVCCLPLLEFGEEGLRGWSQLIVYPEAFRVNRSHVDAAGVLHEWDDDLIGESWDAGPLILSWADIEADLDDPHAGFCVAVHEMVHKLDALDGVLDGTPPLPREWQRAWALDFQQAYDSFAAAVETEREVPIDPYAAEAPEEFFAVCGEYHFSDPATLREAFPRVAAHFERFFGPSPSAGAG